MIDIFSDADDNDEDKEEDPVTLFVLVERDREQRNNAAPFFARTDVGFGRRQLEGLYPSSFGRVGRDLGFRRCCWKGRCIRTLFLSTMLLLIVAFDIVVTRIVRHCCCCCCCYCCCGGD